LATQLRQKDALVARVSAARSHPAEIDRSSRRTPRSRTIKRSPRVANDLAHRSSSPTPPTAASIEARCRGVPHCHRRSPLGSGRPPSAPSTDHTEHQPVGGTPSPPALQRAAPGRCGTPQAIQRRPRSLGGCAGEHPSLPTIPAFRQGFCTVIPFLSSTPP
jgi:hypothetical protein